jgi:hypothetical protein
MATKIKWENADFKWNDNPYTWDEVLLVLELTKGGAGEEEWPQWNEQKKNKFIKLILKVHGDTITESKKREIKQYKIKAKDIKLVVKEVLGVEMIAEDISF